MLAGSESEQHCSAEQTRLRSVQATQIEFAQYAETDCNYETENKTF